MYKKNNLYKTIASNYFTCFICTSYTNGITNKKPRCCNTGGKQSFNHFIQTIMTNLTEIFQFLNDYDEESRLDQLQASKNFFCSSVKNRSIFIDQVKAIDKIEGWMIAAIVDSGIFTLSDGDNDIDFMVLCDSLSDGRIREMYIQIKGIRAEMLAITTPETLEEFKALNEFWESLELAFQVMMK